MIYCDKCGGPLKLIGEVKDINGKLVMIYQCMNCHTIKYI